MSKKDVYIIKLTGPGDFIIKVIGQEKYDWLFSRKPENAEPIGLSSYVDTTCPDWIREEIWNDTGYGPLEEYQLAVGENSPVNDKAMLVVDDYGTFFSMNEYTEFVTNTVDKYNIVNTFEGFVY